MYIRKAARCLRQSTGASSRRQNNSSLVWFGAVPAIAAFGFACIGAGCADHSQKAAAQTQSLTAPAGPPAASAPSAFDAAHAFRDLEAQVAFGPRVPPTGPHEKCRDWLLAQLKQSAGDARLQNFVWTFPDGKTLAMSNIVAQFNPNAPTQVLLCAHWDTRPSADMEIDPAKKRMPIPGADDGASGVAVLLEMARNFAVKKPGIGIEIVLFDGEDYGPSEDRMYLGADYYAKHPALPKPTYAILLDMIGNKGLSVPKEKNSELEAPEIDDKIWRAAKALGVRQFSSEAGLQIDDDQIPMQKAGWKAVDLIDFNYAAWHTLDDKPDKCSPESLKAVGDVLEKVVYDEK